MIGTDRTSSSSSSSSSKQKGTAMQVQLDHELSNAGEARNPIEHPTFNIQRSTSKFGRSTGFSQTSGRAFRPVNRTFRTLWASMPERHGISAAIRMQPSARISPARRCFVFFSAQRQITTKQIPFAEIRGEKAVSAPNEVSNGAEAPKRLPAEAGTPTSSAPWEQMR